MAYRRVINPCGWPIFVDDELAGETWHIDPLPPIYMDTQKMQCMVSLAKNIVDTAYDDKGKGVSPIEFAWGALDSLRKLKLVLEDMWSEDICY